MFQLEPLFFQTPLARTLRWWEQLLGRRPDPIDACTLAERLETVLAATLTRDADGDAWVASHYVVTLHPEAWLAVSALPGAQSGIAARLERHAEAQDWRRPAPIQVELVADRDERVGPAEAYVRAGFPLDAPGAGTIRWTPALEEPVRYQVRQDGRVLATLVPGELRVIGRADPAADPGTIALEDAPLRVSRRHLELVANEHGLSLRPLRDTVYVAESPVVSPMEIHEFPTSVRLGEGTVVELVRCA